jgi:hypothetical protein
MTLHYHGTPLSPTTELMKLAGKCFCVPFSDARDADRCLQIGQSVMFDNGAFSAHTRDKPLDVPGYVKFLEPRLSQPHWAIPPDVIDGTIEQQREALLAWPFPPELSAPVWHMGLSIDYLLELADEWPRICFGSTRQYWQVGSDSWCRRADEAFNALSAAHKHLPWIHMLRGMNLSGDRWPFASVDSVNVARNFKDSNTDPERMARRLDSIQCNTPWAPRKLHEQQDIFA